MLYKQDTQQKTSSQCKKPLLYMKFSNKYIEDDDAANI